MRRLLTIFVLLLIPGLYLAAQQYPVQVTPQLLPPYTLQVSEYYSSGAVTPKLNLLLLLRDFNKPVLQVRLRMSIEGQSVSLHSREDVVYTSMELQSGTPKYVEPAALEQYFNSNNLVFSGMTRQQYEQTGKLPEGFYTFCFEVVEAGTNQTVSNKGCAVAWMTLNEPPILNIPRKAESLAPGIVQNILFQWTPRHTSSPTASFNTDYVFSIVEIADTTMSPEAAFASNQPLWSATTTMTTYLYDDVKPQLLVNHKYAWRVQAKAKEGLLDLALFRNNGYSETFWFSYKNNCPIPAGIAATAQGQRVGIEWNNNAAHLEYKVEYREINNPDAVWFDLGNTLPRISIGDLKPSTTYEYRVGGACDYGQFSFASLNQFTTNDSNATMVPDCGIDPNLTVPNESLLQQLNPGDTIKAGDFKVIATQVTGTGSFSGQGYVAVSWLANMKLAVRFTNIGVTVNKKLASGVIETTYDPTESGIESLDDVIDDVIGFFNDFFGDNWNKFSISTYGGTISGVVINTDGSIGISGNSGSQSLPGDKNYVLTDNSGHTYYISEGGQITQAEGPKGTPIGGTAETSKAITSIDPDMPVVRFAKDIQTKYSFDLADQYLQSGGKKYEQLSTGGTPYFVSWKLLQTGDAETIHATLTDNEESNISLDSIHFKRTDGTIIPVTRDGSSWTITLKGRLNLYTDALWAVVNKYPGTDSATEKILGKINLVNVDKISRIAVIVPVNGQGAQTDAAVVQQKLNEIYKPFAVEWSVSKKPGITVSGYDINAPLKVERKFLNLSYGPDLKSLITAYGDDNDDTSVLFLVNKPDPEDVDGYMALGNKYGFLFLKGSTQVSGKAVAHELGHGVFELTHVFGDNDAEQGKTLNLMDYAGVDDNLLFLEQWKQMHDTKLRIRFGQQVDDGELAGLNNMELLKDFKVNGKYTFLSPSGKMITLPGDIKQVVFATGDVWDKGQCQLKKFEVVPFGTLVRFTLSNGDTYRARKGCNSVTFLGYSRNPDITVPVVLNDLYIDGATYTQNPTKAIIGIPVLDGGHVNYAVGHVTIPNPIAVDQVNYCDGTSQHFDFLETVFNGMYEHPEDVKTIFATLRPDLNSSGEAMKFLQENEGFVKFGSGTGLYVFAHAYQIAQFPEAFNNPCGVLYDRITVDSPLIYMNQMLPTDNTTVVHTNTYHEDRPKWIRQSVIIWESMSLSRYEELVVAMKDVNSLTAVTDPPALQKRLAVYRDNDCVWKGMDITNRLHALKTLLNSNNVNGSWLGLANNREYYVIRLLTTITNFDDAIKILDELKLNNYALLYRAWDKMDGDNLDGFMNTITAWLLQKNPQDKTAFFDTGDQLYGGYPRTSNIFGVFHEDDEYNFNKRTSHMSGNWNVAQGLLTFTSDVRWVNYDGGNAIYSGGAVTYTTDPYSMVGIIFRENFEYNIPGSSKQISEDERLVVPMIWAYWFQHRYNQDEDIRVLRVAGDVIGALLSGGTANVVLRTIEISVSVTDAILTLNHNNIVTTFGTAGTDFLHAWDHIAAAAGGVLIAKGVVSVVANTVRFSYSKLRSVYETLRNNPEELLNFKNSLTSLAAGMKNLVSTASEAIPNLRNLYDRLIDELGFIYMSGSFRPLVQNVSMTIKNTTFAVLLRAGLEIQIATGEFINNYFKLKGGYTFLAAAQSGIPIGRLSNIRYVINGSEKTGDLLIVYVTESGRYYLAAATNTLEELFTAFKPGWSRQKVLTFAKGARPPLSNYLPAAYIESHLARFEQEGMGFIAVKSWIANSAFPEFPLRKFTMLNSDLKIAINNYRTTGKISYIEDAFGYQRNALKGYEDEIFVFYPNKNEFDFHFPDGNEVGVNPEWLPGGLTPVGFREAGITFKSDPGLKIVHNKDIENLKTMFPFEKLK